MNGAGEMLPPLVRTVTARDIVMGAAASRDWQPQHHDGAYAGEMNLPGIIMNTPTQTGWFHSYALKWAGSAARIGRWKLTMLRPVCPGMTVSLGGTVSTRRCAPSGGEWCWLDLAMTASEEALSRMRVLLLIPEIRFRGGNGSPSLADTWPPLATE